MLRLAKHLLSQQLLANISLRDFDSESVVEDRQLQVSVSLVAPLEEDTGGRISANRLPLELLCTTCTEDFGVEQKMPVPIGVSQYPSLTLVLTLGS